jgi:hypothetical protein
VRSLFVCVRPQATRNEVAKPRPLLKRKKRHQALGAQRQLARHAIVVQLKASKQLDTSSSIQSGCYHGALAVVSTDEKRVPHIHPIHGPANAAKSSPLSLKWRGARRTQENPDTAVPVLSATFAPVRAGSDLGVMTWPKATPRRTSEVVTGSRWIGIGPGAKSSTADRSRSAEGACEIRSASSLSV